MKNFRPLIHAIGCAFLLLPLSCSIKEDRSACPCLLHMDYSLVRSDERTSSALNPDSLLVIVRGLHNGIARMSEYPDGQSIYVRRTPSLLSCYLGMREGRLENGRSRLVIPVGEEADALFSYHRYLDLDADTEEEFITPAMCYEYTKVILSFRREDGGAVGDQMLRVSSSSCGLDLNTGEVIAGDFAFVMKRYDDCSWCFNMPRQAGKDIRIDAIGEGAQILFSVDLARELDGAGYDWKAESLPPLVVVNINEQNLPVDVRIIDWEEAVYFNYTL